MGYSGTSDSCRPQSEVGGLLPAINKLVRSILEGIYQKVFVKNLPVYLWRHLRSEGPPSKRFLIGRECRIAHQTIWFRIDYQLAVVA